MNVLRNANRAVTDAWRRFAGDQGHTWLGHQQIVLLATAGGWKAFEAFGWASALWGVAGFVPGFVALGIYAAREMYVQEDLTDMALDWAFALQGFVLGGALVGQLAI